MSYQLRHGNTPLVISIPHMGTHIPPKLQSAYAPRALALEDTDWHLDLLYNFARELGASVLTPAYSRYVIDLNRPPDDTPMYPGAANTELCPTRFFTGEPLYKDALGPDVGERLRRRQTYWQPYHQALETELQRVRAQHGYALLWDAHSIRSQIPWLFEGRLPDLNLGSADGHSAHANITAAVAQVCAHNKDFSHVVNGRFKGGYITRHYGQPAQHIHALQMEMCQCLYMQEQAPFAYVANKAERVQPLLRAMLLAALTAAQALYGN